jgi:Uma2 family endonuclease
VVDCARGAPGDLFATEPTIVFEVLSPSTELFDETDKLADFQSVPSIRQIVLLSQQRRHARSYIREADGWRELRHDGEEAAIPLSGFDLALPLARLYEGVEFEGGA